MATPAPPTPTPSASSVPEAVVETAQRSWDWLMGTPLHIFLVLLISILALFAARLLIGRLTERIARGYSRQIRWLTRKAPLAETSPYASQLPNPERSARRARSVGSVLESVASLTIGTIALLLILDLLGVNIAPFIASAGIAGVALGFGAQTLVKDFLSGIFMLVEDQYGVGDTITVGDISGVVESVALRVTAVRDANGVLWFIRNGEILKVGNQTQGWSRASVTVTVAYETNVADARAALTAAADVAAADPAIGAWLIDEPSVTGIDAMTSQTYTLSVGVKTEPAKQWDVSRVLRAAVRQELDKAGIVPWDEPQLVVVRPAETSPDE